MMTKGLMNFLKRMHEGIIEPIDIIAKNGLKKMHDKRFENNILESLNAYKKTSGYIIKIEKEGFATFKIDLGEAKNWNELDNNLKAECETFIQKEALKYGEKLGFWYDENQKVIILDLVQTIYDIEEFYKTKNESEQYVILDLKSGVAIINRGE